MILDVMPTPSPDIGFSRLIGMIQSSFYGLLFFDLATSTASMTTTAFLGMVNCLQARIRLLFQPDLEMIKSIFQTDYRVTFAPISVLEEGPIDESTILNHLTQMVRLTKTERSGNIFTPRFNRLYPRIQLSM